MLHFRLRTETSGMDCQPFSLITRDRLCNLEEPTMDFRHVKNYLSWLYYQYQIISCCAVLEPWEQSMFNTILLTIFAMVVYTAYVFIPIHVRLAWEFFSKICGYHSTISS
ncbi:serine palmitoyltransferase small subunit B isoform X1 [Erinaceus europaeus]|uniref:Serine palmitoyltransferase small subunit B n=2 Tax=Erinaceus europaeus TaxID=9365 RepID=A0ABM3YDW8_ERIEU|nr:serine palmitoyltransferase small subunit B isoform X1 [Erinaceus europaeus]XP_060059269.1 serine palmitoyltransferase small subunit B isoform X1 [Erinaceus europaeus]XP_060059270.1 serine palmitoyltransferase small subunit B isoform X1 [Erinaceus europaeus]XP_060059271.1 serine palmitoyltransferase small subunit B isoform X1 [Erinaceus europaeus]